MVVMIQTRAVVASTVLLLLLLSSTTGCLSGDDGGDEVNYTEWYVALTMEQFNTNGVRAVNVTYLKFDIRFGPIQRDPWVIQESDTFQKENESVFPLRIEARYEDGVNEVEDFPLMGESNVITGAVIFKSGRLRVNLDGEDSLYTVDRSIDRYPHEHELTVTTTGTNGDLKFYLSMNEPPQ
jgi:hypothetical protein